MFRRRLRLSAAVTASLLIVAPAAISAVPAMAADDDPTVQVTIDSFLPVAAKPGQPVVIKGTVTNTSTATFGNPQAITCIDRDRLTTAAQLAAVPNEQNIPMKDRNSCSGIDTPDTPTFQVLGEKLAPNAKVPFTLTVPWKEWRISNETGVYTVGVTFRGDPQEGSRTTAGRARTLMPVIGAAPKGKVSTALVVPLQHRPTFLGGVLFADDSLAEAMQPGGSLRRALDLGKQHRVTWLVDPALIYAAGKMMDAEHPYRIGPSYKQSVPGTNGKIAQTWLADFAKSQTEVGNQVVALPYGDVDVAGLFDAGGSLKELVRQARMESEQANLGVSARSNGLWLENGAAASRYLAFAASGFRGANEALDLNLINSAAWSTDAAKVLTPGTSVYQVLTPEGPAKQTRAVVADSALTAGGPDAGSDHNPLQVRQRFLAETALLAASNKGATAVVVPPRGWDADGRSTAALAGALTQPWLTSVTVDQVVKATPKPRAIVAPTAPKTNGSLSGPQVDKVKQLEKSINTYTSLLSELGSVSPDMSKGLLQSASLGWNDHADKAGPYADIELGSVKGQLGKVHLVNSSLDKGNAIKVNLAGSNGTFPLTVANDLDHSIRVGVIVRSVNRTDLRVRTVDTVDVRAGQKWTPRINASAEQNGVIQATAQVVTVDGDPVGPPQPMLIQASQYGSVGWILVGAACALLFGTSFVRIYRRIRAERRNPPAADEVAADPSTENDPLHPAPLPAAPGTPATDGDAGLPADASLKEGVGSKDG